MRRGTGSRAAIQDNRETSQGHETRLRLQIHSSCPTDNSHRLPLRTHQLHHVPEPDKRIKRIRPQAPKPQARSLLSGFDLATHPVSEVLSQKVPKDTRGSTSQHLMTKATDPRSMSSSTSTSLAQVNVNVNVNIKSQQSTVAPPPASHCKLVDVGVQRCSCISTLLDLSIELHCGSIFFHHDLVPSTLTSTSTSASLDYMMA